MNITDQLITDLLITAMEGGSNYWVDEVDYNYIPFDAQSPRYARLSECRKHGMIVFNMEDMPTYRLRWDMLHPGLELMKEKYPRHYAAITDESWDAETADVFLQLALFKELIFG